MQDGDTREDFLDCVAIFAILNFEQLLLDIVCPQRRLYVDEGIRTETLEQPQAIEGGTDQAFRKRREHIVWFALLRIK